MSETKWMVVRSPSDAEMYAVEGVYLVADQLPIEDAHLIAAAPDLAHVVAMLLCVDFGSGSEHDELLPDTVIQEARAALSRARGEKPT
jgi:hypothetical protein